MLSQHRLCSCHQLVWAERLRDVVVGPQLESDDLIRLVVADGRHDDRQLTVPAKRPRDYRMMHLCIFVNRDDVLIAGRV